VGVFSGTYDEQDNGFWLMQVWLWESDGAWWGRYLRNHYVRGERRDFISTTAIAPVCSEQCKVLSFPEEGRAVTLTRLSDDELLVMMSWQRDGVTLKRGETLPGFFFDLAPLATERENRQWLDALTTAGMIAWDVPRSAN
jgi:hypothetical protein